jgi:hypothetical protein
MLIQEIEDLKAGRLALECPAMSLVSRGGDNPGRFSGPGRLDMDERGRLRLVLYDSTHNPNPRGILSAVVPGGTIPESDIYALEATDIGGTVWRSEGLTIDRTMHVARPGAIVHATLKVITSEAACEHAGRDWVWLFFAQRVSAPRNVATITTREEVDTGQRSGSSERNVWAIACPGADVRMRFHESAFDVSVRMRDEPAPDELPAIVEESIWFALGQPIRADIVRYHRAGREGIQIHSRGRDEALASAIPPYITNIVDAHAVLGAMLSRYFAYVSSRRSGRYHPLSVLIRKALRAEAGTLEEMALARCVAVEGIADLAFPKLGAPSDETLKAVNSLLKLLEKPLESSPIRERVEGALRAMTGRNARTALHALAEEGVVGEDEVCAWEMLRHAAAHGREYSLPLDEVWNAYEQVRVLMSRLVFETIGYVGAYTDYGSPGWPVRMHGHAPTASNTASG